MQDQQVVLRDLITVHGKTLYHQHTRVCCYVNCLRDLLCEDEAERFEMTACIDPDIRVIYQFPGSGRKYKELGPSSVVGSKHRL